MMNRHRIELKWVRAGIEEGWIGRYEKESLLFLQQEYGSLPTSVAAAALFLLLFLREGHVCLPLDKDPKWWARRLDLNIESFPEDVQVDPESLHAHPAFGKEKGDTPFVISNNRLFTRRNLELEISIVEKLEQFDTDRRSEYEPEKAGAFYSNYFGDPAAEPDWQKAATLLSLRNRFMIISGGPGTGKTTTAAGVLYLLQKLEDRKLRIALAAPTGKAAARLSQTIHNNLAEKGVPDACLEQIPAEAKTIHRLIQKNEEKGMLPAANREHLPYDVIVIDEASMIDLYMMERVLTYTGPNTRLILLGDIDQLSSVESGSVLADICFKTENDFSDEAVAFLRKAGVQGKIETRSDSELADTIIYLKKNYRFNPESGIAMLAEAARNQDTKTALEQFDKSTPGLSHSDFNYNKKGLDRLFEYAGQKIARLQSLSPKDRLLYLNQEIWLGVLRKGPYGVNRLNRMIEDYLRSNRIVRSENGWYDCRPILITRNDYSIEVFNGDLGLAIKTEQGSWSVHFLTTQGNIKKVTAHNLTDYQPAYMLTVHKSQGSEFDQVNLLLPDRDTPLLTKELIYTALTRSRNSVHLYGSRELFAEGLKRKTERFTGLETRLAVSRDNIS